MTTEPELKTRTVVQLYAIVGSMRVSLIAAACAACLAAPPPPQDWSHGWENALASQFIDFGYQALTQEQAAFVATHYAISSFEKCTGPGPTEPNVYATAARVKAANPAAKVMFYWDVVSGLARCARGEANTNHSPVLPPFVHAGPNCPVLLQHLRDLHGPL